MKSEVARPRPRPGHEGGRSQGRELTVGCVESVAQYLVGAQVYGKGEGVGRVGHDAVSVRAGLVGVRPGADVLVDGGGGGQLPVGRCHWQQGHVAAHIVGH